MVGSLTHSTLQVSLSKERAGIVVAHMLLKLVLNSLINAEILAFCLRTFALGRVDSLFIAS